MKVARYLGGGQIAIVDEPEPKCPPGGLIVKTEACGLCSGELMDWYMDRKIPHVLGHEVAGKVVRTDAALVQVGDRVFAHHHAACMQCGFCRSGRFVHCAKWKQSRLKPGGMAEYYSAQDCALTDTLTLNELAPQDAALIEPLACALKSLKAGGAHRGYSFDEDRQIAVIGLGSMGLMHLLAARTANKAGYDLNPARVEWAKQLGLDARQAPAEPKIRADVVFVCPGSSAALDAALRMVRPGGKVILFAPMPPNSPVSIDLEVLYFLEAQVIPSYSCGPDDVADAAVLVGSYVRAEQVVSHFISIDELPKAYQAMKMGEILKPMVMF
jgi:L-iditol 2-dehydrogenase